MTSKPLVYVSSTFGDLLEYRQEAIESILSLGAIPVAMEDFGSNPSSPLDICRDKVRGSDVMVLILAHRYGAVLPGMDASITEYEYGAAREAGKPVLAFIIKPQIPWPPQLIDVGQEARCLDRFKRRVLSEVVVGYFSSPSDLAIRVVQALHRTVPTLRRTSDSALHASEPAVPQHGDDPRMVRIEEHLNFLRTSFSEMRDQLGQNVSVPFAVASGSAATFLGAAGALEKDLCFVAMPYSKDWSKALEDILLDICRDSGMRLLVAKNMDGRFIPNDIWRGITSAAVVIADITDGNPNVAYEIGLADVLGRDVILLCQGKDVPFDFLGQRLICYENTMKGSIVLREELTARLRRIHEKLNDEI